MIEANEYKKQLESFKKHFIRRMTVDSETQDRRRKDFNQALFFLDPDTMEYRPSWSEIDLHMVLKCFDDAMGDWQRELKGKGDNGC